MTEGYFVQVRYRHGWRWVSVAVSERRETASSLAADASRGLRNARGETPRQVRVVSAAQLVREGGQREIGLAAADLAQRAKRPR